MSSWSKAWPAIFARILGLALLAHCAPFFAAASISPNSQTNYVRQADSAAQEPAEVEEEPVADRSDEAGPDESGPASDDTESASGDTEEAAETDPVPVPPTESTMRDGAASPTSSPTPVAFTPDTAAPPAIPPDGTATSSELTMTNLLRAGALEVEQHVEGAPIGVLPILTKIPSADRPAVTQLDGIAQGVMNAGIILLVLVATSVYTGSLRKRLAQQKEFIHKRGEALAAVEVRLRESFETTRAELECRIQSQQTELAQLEIALAAETQARIRAEAALNRRCRPQPPDPGPAPRDPQPAGNDSAAASSQAVEWPGALCYDLRCVNRPIEIARPPANRPHKKIQSPRTPVAAFEP